MMISSEYRSIDDYVCNTLKEWLTMAGDEARERLEKIHAAL